MRILEPLILGAVQGITEFLPISSSAHLDIVPVLLGWPKPGAAFTAVIQLGTLAAVFAAFARDIAHTLTGAWKAFRNGERQAPEVRLLLAVVLGTIPIGVLGLLFKDWIEGPLHNLWINAGMLVVMGIALALADKFARHARGLETVTVRDGLVVGAAQAIALIPGASRSGSTLVGAYLTGLDRAAAVRFSFLLSLPAVLLSGLFELKGLREAKAADVAAGGVVWADSEIVLATVVAGLVGYACIAWLLRYLAKHTALAFVIYRILLGAVLAVLLATGRIAP
ncbi:MAG: undecaprenyl-diphosphatase UppP [Armatimonadota bacterium]